MLPSMTGAGLTVWAALQLQLPAPTGMVNDFAGILPAATAERLERLALSVRARSGGEIAVVTLKDLGGREAGDVALEIGRLWKVGKAGQIGDRARNAGVVLLVVPKESSADGRGHMYIATGQGAEGFITDAVAGDIRREAIPMLRTGDYGSAVTLMTQRIAERYAAEFGFALDSLDLIRVAAPRAPPVRGARTSPLVFLIGFVVLFILLSSLSRRGRRGGGLFIYPGGGFGGGSGGWGSGGGGGGGGFSGFGGGGGFSGGGSGGDW